MDERGVSGEEQAAATALALRGRGRVRGPVVVEAHEGVLGHPQWAERRRRMLNSPKMTTAAMTMIPAMSIAGSCLQPGITSRQRQPDPGRFNDHTLESDY